MQRLRLWAWIFRRSITSTTAPTRAPGRVIHRFPLNPGEYHSTVAGLSNTATFQLGRGWLNRRDYDQKKLMSLQANDAGFARLYDAIEELARRVLPQMGCDVPPKGNYVYTHMSFNLLDGDLSTLSGHCDGKDARPTALISCNPCGEAAPYSGGELLLLDFAAPIRYDIRDVVFFRGADVYHQVLPLRPANPEVRGRVPPQRFSIAFYTRT